jgi:glycerophosphoryl diester phosphodiesterase
VERDVTPVIYGHRGARGEAPENTVTGFAYAQRIGVTAFELDVHLSSDQELVVIHDPDVDRTTNGHGPVSAFTASELAALDARAAFPAWPEPSGVPRLVDVLDAFAGTQAFQIEIKTNAPDVLEIVAQKLVDLIGRYAIGDRTEVSSFDPAALAIMRRIAPEIPRAYIGRYDTPEHLATALALGCAGACIPHKTSSRAIVDEAHAFGLHVTGWLGNTQRELRLLLDWSVESITSDFPSVALNVLRAQSPAAPR